MEEIFKKLDRLADGLILVIKELEKLRETVEKRGSISNHPEQGQEATNSLLKKPSGDPSGTKSETASEN